MFSFLARGLASLSLALKQPLPAFCEHRDGAWRRADHQGRHYLSWIRVDGMQRMAERKDFAAHHRGDALDLSGALETRGHAIVGWYISDPDAALVEIERLNLNACRAVAREAGLDLDDILDERARLWPTLMRWEASYFIVWTRPDVLTKEERKQLKAEYAANAAAAGAIGDDPALHLCAARSWRRAMPPSSRACSRRCARTTSPPRCSSRTRRCGSRARRCIARWPARSGGRACRATG